jgi:hypothetical protein
MITRVSMKVSDTSLCSLMRLPGVPTTISTGLSSRFFICFELGPEVTHATRTRAWWESSLATLCTCVCVCVCVYPLACLSVCIFVCVRVFVCMHVHV